jgi:hypothetical protein
MGNGIFTVQYLMRAALLFFVCLAGFPETGGAAPSREPVAFQQLGAKVLSLRFYTTLEPKMPPMKGRVYRTAFSGTDRFLWWELCLETKAKRDVPVRLIMYITWQRPDGSEHYQSEVAVIPPQFQSLCISAGWRDQRPDAWIVGSYNVSIRVDEKIVASENFEVFNKILKED